MNIEVASVNEMIMFGEKIGRLLHGGEMIELVGDIGAGKTTFVKGIARGLEINDPVQSPTFTISRVYHGRDNVLLSHYDFYRLHEAGIMIDEIDEMIHDDRTVTIVEWGEAVADVLPEDRLTVVIVSPSEELRRLELTATGKKSQQIVEQLT